MAFSVILSQCSFHTIQQRLDLNCEANCSIHTVGGGERKQLEPLYREKKEWTIALGREDFPLFLSETTNVKVL